jgi:hypothetical protein
MSYLGRCEASPVATSVCASGVGSSSASTTVDLTAHSQWCLSANAPSQLLSISSIQLSVSGVGAPLDFNVLSGITGSGITPALLTTVPRGVYTVSAGVTGAAAILPSSVSVNVLAVPKF